MAHLLFGGMEIVRKAIAMRADAELNVDRRLLTRRACEYEIFQSLEEAVELPRISAGFDRLGDFLGVAQSILQRRKSRAGNSLEFHTREILVEENFADGESFAWQPNIPGESKPDFLFPSLDAYSDNSFPVANLRLLAVKTTCKDRWRQVTREARRLDGHDRHILTLQEGVSENQFREMGEARVKLVVPAGLHKSYPKSVRPHLLTFESFLADLRLLNVQ